MHIKANLIDIVNRSIYPAQIVIEDARIKSITPIDEKLESYILQGFIDAHVHIESSLLVPSEFARMAVLHGTVGTISDPHEIANVLGMAGVEYMIYNAKQVPFHFNFGAPSCVPATIFETAGASISVDEVEQLLASHDILYLSEMMNFPGVLHEDPEVMAKIAAAKKYNKPVDGHAPGLTGEQAKKYISAGISTDHECFTYEEALFKIQQGMKVLIREGSAAKNFEALITLMDEHYQMLMFCSDDKHADALELGHINQLVARALQKGKDLFKVLQIACLNPIEHYKMEVGKLQVGDWADFIITRDLQNFIIDQTYIKGELVANKGQSMINRIQVDCVNHFDCAPKTLADFAYPIKEQEHVIECLDGQLITNKLVFEKKEILSENDILKMVVINRYKTAPVAISFVKNFGLKEGAIASSVAHDSHNIIAVGVDDESIRQAVNVLIANNGGLSAVNTQTQKVLPLPVAGLMSDKDAWQVSKDYTEVDNFAKQILGSSLQAPFMSLSFMALLVIPHLKLSDKGLFDGDSFQFI
jgi:adenine deaminase